MQARDEVVEGTESQRVPTEPIQTQTIVDAEGGATRQSKKKSLPEGSDHINNLKGFKLLCDNASHLENLV